VDWCEVLKSLCFWGPGMVIAGIMIAALYKLADKYLGEFIRAQQGQAASLAQLAQGTEGLRDSVQAFVARDNREHREMIILLKCVTDKLEKIEEQTYGC
jgi:hypothetical protein